MIIRKAKLSDTEEILEVVNKYAKDGLMLPRSRSMVYECIREFTVIERDGQIIGVGSLHIMWVDLAEIRSLAVKEDYLLQGAGKKLVQYLMQEARKLGIGKLFTLTYKTEFFEKLNFSKVPKEKMPQKVWKECINCPKFPDCDEVCMECILMSEKL
ncbi:MAG: N-acetyltransferase [Clostridia bacterium]|nr:N-acetyltransferase [Clostridia bacterium]